MDELERALHEHFGFEQFRSGQREVIEHVMARRHTLAVLPTGRGKSLCYQLPAQLLPGLTLVISPLIALMQDQTTALERRGFRNVTSLSSALTQSEIGRRFAEIERGEHKLVYIAPERFDSPRFQQLVRQAEISLVVIDEAHCISQWGHDFRPHYRTLLTRLPELRRATLLAVTATATPEVQNDISASLALPTLERVIADFNRPNLHLETIKADAREEKDRQVVELLKRDAGAAIVYASTRKEAAAVHQLLGGHGFNVCLYHAGLDTRQRTEAQQRFWKDDCRVIVATVAFGLGIDKPNVRRVIHYNLPGSLENYYQEAGRGGRDGATATCTLFYSQPDVRIQRFLLDQAYPQPQVLLKLFDMLREAHPLAVAASDLVTAGQLPEIAVNAALQALYEQQRVRITAEGKYALAQIAESEPKFDVRDLNERRWRANERLKKMIAYALDAKCRRAAILDYFGQEFAAPCPACDVCAAKPPAPKPQPETAATEPRNRTAYVTLRTAAELGGRFGRTLVAELLAGSKRKRIIEMGLDRSPNYGALRPNGREQILTWIDELVAQQFLLVTAEEYPRLVITEAGRRLLEEEKPQSSSVSFLPPPAITGQALNENVTALERKELLSEKTATGSRTYRFDVKETTQGARYLTITEEQEAGSDHKAHRVTVFEDHVEEFYQELKKALRLLGIEESNRLPNRLDDIKRQYPKAYERWEPEEDRLLKEKFAAGVKIKELAASFERQPNAIRSRLIRLGLLQSGRQETG